MKKGLLIIFSGPSGVGKGTILKKLMEYPQLNLAYSVSMTTRPKREGEVEGVNYFFVDEPTFLKAVQKGKLLEYATFVGHYYGTPKKYVEQERQAGKNVILEIETVGAEKVMELTKDDPLRLSIFLTPPSLLELERRIRGRKSESDEVIKQRIAKARLEMTKTDRYDHVVCNDNINRTVDEIYDIIAKAMAK